MNLLTEPLLRAQTTTGLTALSLPGLLAALGTDTVASLPGLQRHQEDAFHIFLCYVAGAVLARAENTNPIQPESFWRDGLRQLAGRDDDDAWTLVVEDVMQPAFMQAPFANKADRSKFTPKADTPDTLDVLQTAKNHDVKSQRVWEHDPEDWIYALISLQTMAGFMGRGNYGIGRMNSGTGSRVCIGLDYDEGLGGRWQRETRKLLDYRQGLLAGSLNYRADGLVFMWLRAWDLETGLSFAELDPFFIEIARAVRLVVKDGRMQALGAATKSNRLAVMELKGTKGIVGDPWTPWIDDGKEKKAWTVMAPFFTPEKLCHVLLEHGGFIRPAMLEPDSEYAARPCWLRASVLAPGGMGKTDGFHEARIRIPARAAPRLFGGQAAREPLAKRSDIGLHDAGAMYQKVLKPALYTWLEAGPEQLNFDKREVTSWVEQSGRAFHAAWEDIFFDWLWRTLDEPEEFGRLAWLHILEWHARKTLDDMIARFPSRIGRYYRSRVKTEGMFKGALWKNFPELKEKVDA